MKIVLVLALTITFAVAGHAQIAKAVSEDVRSSEKTIKGAPFTADAKTESVQILSDGTRITRSNTSKLYRDNEGRYRRDDNAKQLGVPGANIEVQEATTIIDPVSGLRYAVNVKKKTVHQASLRSSVEFKMELKHNEDFANQVKMEIKKSEEWEKQADREAKQAAQEAKEAAKISEQETRKSASRTANNNGGPNRGSLKIGKPSDIKPVKIEPPKSDKPGPNSKTESLGKQSIEGVEAEGKRTTTTIPAGTIGNDRDINVVYEKWYSNELQMTIMSKHTDPRFGEQTYRLSNISRNNPPLTDFTPPTDYQLIGENGRTSPPRVTDKPVSPKGAVKPVTAKPSKVGS